MTETSENYDPRYLAGVLFFNQRDFFEAHEVWEDLWKDSAGPERRFVQGLIQAAVALYHFGNGNIRGAVKLYHSSREYMQKYDSPYLGLDATAFWRQMDRCFAEALAPAAEDIRPALKEEWIPTITLDPPPTSWPSLAEWEEKPSDD